MTLIWLIFTDFFLLPSWTFFVFGPNAFQFLSLLAFGQDLLDLGVLGLTGKKDE